MQSLPAGVAITAHQSRASLDVRVELQLDSVRVPEGEPDASRVVFERSDLRAQLAEALRESF